MFANDAENEASSAPDQAAASAESAPAAGETASRPEPAPAAEPSGDAGKEAGGAEAKPDAASSDKPAEAAPSAQASDTSAAGDTGETVAAGADGGAGTGEGTPEGKRRRGRRRGRDRGERDGDGASAADGEGASEGGERRERPPRGDRPVRERRDDRGPRERRAPEDAPRDAQAITDFLTNDRYPLLNQVAERLGRDWGSRPPWVKSRLTTQQIRKCYGEVQRLKLAPRFDATSATRLLLIKPHVAYLARRFHVEDLYEFSRVLRHCVDTVGNDATRFTRFTTFFDALMAYFRAHGGK